MEVNTKWKIRDCEELLKIRVSDKFVWETVAQAEERLKKELVKLNEPMIAKQEHLVKKLARDFDLM